MGFIDAYKRLEKLCGDILNNDRCLSAYIDEMRNTTQGSYLVRGWDEDLKQLKHYRWIRNQIVHEPDCDEENMCSEDDTQWIENFYSRIMNQTDPLALYCQATQPKRTPDRKIDGLYHQEIYNSYHQESRNNYYQKEQKPSGCGMALLIVVIIAVVVVAILILIKVCSIFLPLTKIFSDLEAFISVACRQ